MNYSWLNKPKFNYADFHWNFPTWKVVDTNYESCGHKQWQIVKPWSFGESRRHKSQKSRTQTILTRWFATKSMTSPRQTRLCHSNRICPVTMHGESRQQSPQQVSDKVVDLSRTQIIKVSDVILLWTFMICVRDKSVTLSQSRRNGIWVISSTTGFIYLTN